MRQFVFGLFTAALLALTTPAPATAQENAPRNPAIEETIQNQFDAFKAQDFGQAFSYASPTIKGMFGTADNFGTMVRNGYPMVADPGAVRMLELRNVAGGLWQRVMVTDKGGRVHMLDYQMVETPEGWQINAVQLLPEAGVGA